jgi:hypothetical protein
MPEIVDPTRERKFLTDSNYYRLGYQLAAQLMHREESGQRPEARHQTAFEILYGDRKQLRRDPFDPAGEAEDLIGKAKEVLRWFQDRQETKRWRLFQGKLTIKEERLQTFLRRTVIPCLTIVIAASLRRTDPLGAEKKVAPLRSECEAQLQTRVQKPTISYRAVYNLACYEAGDPEMRKQWVLRYLAAALDLAPGGRRSELGNWARKDPSFGHLRDDPAFKELLKPYK